MVKILVAYDGSDCSDKALRDLRNAGLPEEAETTVLTIADDWTRRANLMSYPASLLDPLGTLDSMELSYEEGKKTAKKGAEILKEYFPGWIVDAQCTENLAADGVIEGINERKPDFVVMGSHGRSAPIRLLFGSVSQKVLTHVHCNLRISRGRDNKEKQTAPLRIVVAYDGSQESETAFDTVLCRHWPKGTAIRLITVTDMRVSTAFLRPTGPMRYWTTDEDKDPVAWVDRMLSYQKKRIEEKGLIGYSQSLKGDPKRVLLKEAEEWGADSIFVGCRGLTGREGIIAGSVSTSLAMHAHCSVEVVHRLWDATACCDRVHEEHRDSMTRECGCKAKK